MYGLTNELTKEIKKLGRKYNIKIYIFGSRARGDYKENSDIDIAIMQEVSKELKYKIMDEFDKIDTCYKIDLIFIQDIKNKDFLNSIQEDRKEF